MRELFRGLPTFVKVFIGVAFTMVVLFWMAIFIFAYGFVTTLLNPDAIGSYVGKVQSGYEREAGK